MYSFKFTNDLQESTLSFFRVGVTEVKANKEHITNQLPLACFSKLKMVKVDSSKTAKCWTTRRHVPRDSSRLLSA